MKRNFDIMLGKNRPQQQKGVSIEVVVKDLAEKHNTLVQNVNSITEQFNGALLQLTNNGEVLQNQLFQSTHKLKTCLFHIDRLNVESQVLKEFLHSKGIDFSGYKEQFDSVLAADFGVDSNNVPIGICTVSYYG